MVGTSRHFSAAAAGCGSSCENFAHHPPGNSLKPHVERPQPSAEYATPERCRILESWNVAADPDVSIARARVAPGVTTRLHRLSGVTERYLVVEGTGRVRVGDDLVEEVAPGDVVIVPPGTSQQVTNTGAADLVFYCICTPRFTQECYEAID
jgi:mannose-6-phosphate isomerase-like protein (cupin superfamily)